MGCSLYRPRFYLTVSRRPSEHAAVLPLLALTLEVEKKIAWPSDDFVGVSMFRRYESVHRQEGVVWRGDESLRVVGGVRVALSKVVRPRSPAGLLRAHALSLLLGAAHSERRQLRGSQRLVPHVGLPDHGPRDCLKQIPKFQSPEDRKKGRHVSWSESGVRSPESGVRSPESGLVRTGPESGVRPE